MLTQKIKNRVEIDELKITNENLKIEMEGLDSEFNVLREVNRNFKG